MPPRSVTGRWLATLMAASLLLTGPFGAIAQEGDTAPPTDDNAADDPGDGTAADGDTEAEGDDGEEEGPDIGPQLGLTILGAASLIGGIVFLFESGDSDDAADEAERDGDDNRANDLRDRADRESTLGIVLTSLAAAMIGGATYLWIRSAREDDGAEGLSFRVTPSIDPRGGASLVIGGRF